MTLVRFNFLCALLFVASIMGVMRAPAAPVQYDTAKPVPGEANETLNDRKRGTSTCDHEQGSDDEAAETAPSHPVGGGRHPPHAISWARMGQF